MTPTNKGAVPGLQMQIRQGLKCKYLFLKTPENKYLAFAEVSAEEAARDCGAAGQGDIRNLCRQVCGF